MSGTRQSTPFQGQGSQHQLIPPGFVLHHVPAKTDTLTDRQTDWLTDRQTDSLTDYLQAVCVGRKWSRICIITKWIQASQFCHCLSEEPIHLSQAVHNGPHTLKSETVTTKQKRMQCIPDIIHSWHTANDSWTWIMYSQTCLMYSQTSKQYSQMSMVLTGTGWSMGGLPQYPAAHRLPWTYNFHHQVQGQGWNLHSASGTSPQLSVDTCSVIRKK